MDCGLCGKEVGIGEFEHDACLAEYAGRIEQQRCLYCGNGGKLILLSCLDCGPAPPSYRNYPGP